MKKRSIILWACLAAVLVLAKCFSVNETDAIPRDAVALGEKLFFDPILSSTRQISCASCHRPEFAFADTVALSLGVRNRKGLRNTPSAMNVAGHASFFWDGRAATLEEQALIPIANPDEMDLPVDSAISRLQRDSLYARAFQHIFGEAPSAGNLAAALAAFQRSMETADTPFDDWRLHDNADAVSESAKRGFALFNGDARCVQCHFGSDFANIEFRNIGLFDGRTLLDSGRAAITKMPADLGKFKIGPLRNIALTPPYMHNGLFKTLREVIDYYNDPDKVVPHPINRDTLLATPLNLSEQDKMDIESFLRSLTSRKLAATPTGALSAPAR